MIVPKPSAPIAMRLLVNLVARGTRRAYALSSLVPGPPLAGNL